MGNKASDFCEALESLGASPLLGFHRELLETL